MVRLTIFFYILLFSLTLRSEELNNEEKILFNFIDLNNNKIISLEEINQSIKLIFQLIDLNNDGNLNEHEIYELKDIIKLLS